MNFEAESSPREAPTVHTSDDEEAPPLKKARFTPATTASSYDQAPSTSSPLSYDDFPTYMAPAPPYPAWNASNYYGIQGDPSETEWAVRRLCQFRQPAQYPAYCYDTMNSGSASAQGPSASAAAAHQAISIFDMVELVVTCPTFTHFIGSEFGRQLESGGGGTGEDFQNIFAHQHLLEPYLRFNRRIGVHAGITLYNLHRVLCFCFGYDQDLAEYPLHVWSIPNSTSLFANGHIFREEARKFKQLMTDKTVALNDCLPIDTWQGFQIGYSLGDLQFTLVISDLLKGQTAQQDLLWVPRMCEGSYGHAPPSLLVGHRQYTKLLAKYSLGGNIGVESGRHSNLYYQRTTSEQLASSSRASSAGGGYGGRDIDSSSEDSSDKRPRDQAWKEVITKRLWDNLLKEALRFPTFDIDAINRVLSETRFGRNLAVSRKSKRTRIAALKEEGTRLLQFRLPIRAFFGEPICKPLTDSFLEKPKRKRKKAATPP